MDADLEWMEPIIADNAIIGFFVLYKELYMKSGSSLYEAE